MKPRLRPQPASSSSKPPTVKTTDDTLTSLAGLAPFVRYLERIAVLPLIGDILGPVKKHGKGAGLDEFLKQMLCFFFDGSSRALSYFHQLAQDPGYAAAIQTLAQRMISSHAVKRFCQAQGLLGAGLWRPARASHADRCILPQAVPVATARRAAGSA